MTTSYDALAYIGGSVLAICLIPQLYLMWLNKSAKDVSLLWTILYIVGLVLTLAYLICIQAFAGWVAILPELTILIFVMFSKLYFDNEYKKTILDDESKKYSMKSNGNISTYLENENIIQTSKVIGKHIYLDYSQLYYNPLNSKEISKCLLIAIEECLLPSQLNLVNKKITVLELSNLPIGFQIYLSINSFYVSIYSCNNNIDEVNMNMSILRINLYQPFNNNQQIETIDTNNDTYTIDINNSINNNNTYISNDIVKNIIEKLHIMIMEYFPLCNSQIHSYTMKESIILDEIDLSNDSISIKSKESSYTNTAIQELPNILEYNHNDIIPYEEDTTWYDMNTNEKFNVNIKISCI